jgi:hypothetical protein
MEEARRRIRRWKKQRNPRKWLNLSGLNLTELPQIPSKVRRLNCSSNYLVAFMNKLPNNLKQLRCGYNTFQTFDSLPPQLKTLNCAWSGGMNLLESLPDSIECIVAEQCERITKIQNLPSQLKYLNLSCTYSLKSLESFPPNLKECIIIESNLERLPELPSSLVSLTCDQSYIKVLPPLPNTLEYLSIFGNNLQKFPKLPKTIQYLDIRDNNHLSLEGVSIPDTLITFLYDKDGIEVDRIGIEV